MATAKNAGWPPSGARPEQKVSDRISYPGAPTIGGARDTGGVALGSATIQLRLALGWGMVAPRSALGWGQPSLESDLVLNTRALSLGIRFLSTFPSALVSTSLAPMIGDLVPFRSALGYGEAVTPLTGGLACCI
jgi:hypothetical protein